MRGRLPRRVIGARPCGRDGTAARKAMTPP